MALTQAQIAMHWGAMLDFGLDRIAAQDVPGVDQLNFALEDFIRLAFRYITAGTPGTQADRKEAMQAFVKRLFSSLTGADPLIAVHAFRRHWLDAREPGSSTDLG
jgi:hypothetical protein